MKRVGIGDIVDDDSNGRIADVGRNEGSKPFLARGVPQLKPHGPVFQIHCLRQEIDADGGLVGVVEGIIHEPGDEGGLSDRLLSEEDELELPEGVVERVSGRCHVGQLRFCHEIDDALKGVSFLVPPTLSVS